MRVDHPTGVTLYFPNDWSASVDPSQEIAIILMAPPDASGFSRNVTITIGEIEPGPEYLAHWQSSSTQTLLSVLEDSMLIYSMNDEDSFRHLISYVLEDRALTLEQWGRTWTRPENTLGITISATTGALGYGEYLEEMTNIAWSVYFPEGES